MNYQKIYDALIARARETCYGGYVEVHHIVPRCLGGADSLSNLVALPAREHFVAHQLLAKIHRGKLLHAAWRMSNYKRYGNRRYRWLKERAAHEASLVDRAGEKNPMYGRTGEKSPHYGKKWGDERKRKISQSQIGKKLTEACKAKIAESRRGRRASEETRAKMSESRRGRKYSVESKLKMSAAHKGRVRSQAHCDNISRAKLGRCLSEATKEKMRQARVRNLQKQGELLFLTIA